MKIDQDLIDEERQERYNRALQRRLATCGDRDYPQYLAQQDILNQMSCPDCGKSDKYCRCIVDISEGEVE